MTRKQRRGRKEGVLVGGWRGKYLIYIKGRLGK